MSIDRISFVGIDARTDLAQLDVLAAMSSVKLEFGVLYSESKKGNRYPTQQVINDFATIRRGVLPYALSLHLCGTSVDKFLNQDTKFLADMFNSNEFDPIQLNFTLKSEKDIPSIVERAIDSTWVVGHNEVIFQANKSKQKLVDYIIDQKDEDDAVKIRLLYDGSGGFGRTIQKIDKPFDGFYTGYAGGINPETIAKIAHDVELASGPTPVYLDMESGVRENDWFSIEKCKQIIEAVNKVKEQSPWSKTINE